MQIDRSEPYHPLIESLKKTILHRVHERSLYLVENDNSER